MGEGEWDMTGTIPPAPAASLKGRIRSAQHLLPGLQTAPPNWVIPAVKVWEGPGPWTSLLVLTSAWNLAYLLGG